MTPTCIGWSQIFLPCSMWMSHKYLKQLQIWKYLHLQRRWQKSVLLFCSPFLYYVIWSGVNLDTSFSTIESITSNSLSSAKRMIMSLPCLKPLMVFNYIWIKIYNPSVTYKDIHNLILATHWFSFSRLWTFKAVSRYCKTLFMWLPHTLLAVAGLYSSIFPCWYLFSSPTLQHVFLLKSLIASSNFQ